MSHSTNQHNDLLLHPDCCKQSSAFIYAKFDLKAIDHQLADFDILRKFKPLWHIKIDNNYDYDHPLGNIRSTPIQLCPWCTSKLPDFELNDKAPSDDKLRKDDNGYYCDNCNERSMECQCISPIILWKCKDG